MLESTSVASKSPPSRLKRWSGTRHATVRSPRPSLLDENRYKAGDVIGFTGYGAESFLINAATYGIPFYSLSHVGILADYHGELLLFESTTLTNLPCEIQGKPVKGSQAHKLADRVANYNGKAYHYPLYRPLFGDESRRLSDFLSETIGLPYDRVGAFRAGALGFSLLESLRTESALHSLFCSEWCAAAHRTIGIFPTDSISRWSPNHLVRTERRMGLLLRPHLISEELCTNSLLLGSA